MSRHCLMLAFAVATLLQNAAANAQFVRESAADGQAKEPTAASDAAQPDLTDVERQIVRRTNAFRRRQKLESVETNDALEKTAQSFADYMAKTDKYSHTADGRQPSERAADHDYEYCIVSENIAFQFSTVGFQTAELAKNFVEGWIDSPPHRKNMADADVTDIGVAVAQSSTSKKFYAVQMFGRPKSKQIEFSVANHTGREVEYRLDGQEFTLLPRFTRTHQRCRSTELTFEEPNAERSTDAKREKTTLEPADGDRLVVTIDEQGRLAVRAEP